MSIVDWVSQTLFSACGLESLPLEPDATTLEWMEQSAVGSCVMQTPAGFYIMLGIHSIGLAMIVGAMMVADLRVLGFARGISAQALPKFVTLGWWGFWINAASGIALFIGEANKLFYDTTFRWKLFLILLGMINTYFINRTIFKPAAAGNPALLDGASARLQATLSLLLWLAVIITGRMIAYLSEFSA
ncbi:MAG: hypothetical protein QM808_15270 [Steroidobacteraceae bacterium]